MKMWAGVKIRFRFFLTGYLVFFFFSLGTLFNCRYTCKLIKLIIIIIKINKTNFENYIDYTDNVDSSRKI